MSSTIGGTAITMASSPVVSPDRLVDYLVESLAYNGDIGKFKFVIPRGIEPQPFEPCRLSKVRGFEGSTFKCSYLDANLQVPVYRSFGHL